MAANITSDHNGILNLLAGDLVQSPGKYVVAAAVLFAAVLFHKLASPSLDSREPPLLKPTIPIIGHLIGIIRHEAGYPKMLYDVSRRQIATLPILGGKQYVIFDPAVVQSAYRQKTLSIEPLAAEFARGLLGISDGTEHKLKTTTLVADIFATIHPAMTGAHLHRMNANALTYVSKELNGIDASGGLERSNLWLWLRDLITMATSEAMYGPGNPLKETPSLIDDFWSFEAGIGLLMLNVMPSITAAKPHQARARLRAALGAYYAARKYEHEDAAELVRGRVGAIIKHGVSREEAGHMELSLLQVATANTIPTLFWFFVHVFSRPELVRRLRHEALPVVQRTGDEAVIDITVLEQQCPLLVSCYREVIRVTSQATGHRRVMEDTVVSDGKGGEWLLKKGLNVQVSALVSHSMGVWGADPLAFDPERFLEGAARDNSEDGKARRAAYHPFGGGRNLCPGRNFAFAENVGLVVSLLAGFEVTLPDGPALPTPTQVAFSQTSSKPVNNGEGFGVRLKRKKGWESAQWSFVS